MSSPPEIPAEKAPKPAILAVDDEPAVLSAVVRDLRREYGAEYRVLRAGSGKDALEALRQLKLKDIPLALVVADQRMPGMSGVEFLAEAVGIFPDMKKVLLTAYADTDAAIRAINDVHLDHYLLKPWDPPEEQLYPVVTDLLDDWRATYRRSFEGIRVVGHRWSAEGHRIRDFLARNLMPFRWLDVETDPDAEELLALVDAGPDDVPVVVFPDGSHLVAPENHEIAARMGLHTAPDAEVYDLVIVGAGPAGLAAGVYGASEGLRTLLVERQAPGGQAGMSASIENYLGFPVGLSGSDLSRRAVAQALRFGAEILTAREAVGLESKSGYPVVQLGDGTRVAAQALLIATGVAYNMLDVPGADRLAGAGIYYGAAITEAMASRDRDVVVVGGGNSAGQAAIYLAATARSVGMLVRNRDLSSSMSSYLARRIEETENIRVRTRAEVVEVHGDSRVEEISVREGDSSEPKREPVHALFVFIGARPRTAWLEGNVSCDKRGFILSGPEVMPDGKRPPDWTPPRDPFWLETSMPGVFVAGDVRHRSVKRIASAVGEGAMAVQFVHQHLSGLSLAPTAAREAAPPREAAAAGGSRERR